MLKAQILLGGSSVLAHWGLILVVHGGTLRESTSHWKGGSPRLTFKVVIRTLTTRGYFLLQVHKTAASHPAWHSHSKQEESRKQRAKVICQVSPLLSESNNFPGRQINQTKNYDQLAMIEFTTILLHCYRERNEYISFCFEMMLFLLFKKDLFTYLKEQRRFSCWFALQMTITTRAGLVETLEREASSSYPMWVAGASVLGLTSTAFLGTLQEEGLEVEQPTPRQWSPPHILERPETLHLPQHTLPQDFRPVVTFSQVTTCEISSNQTATMCHDILPNLDSIKQDSR